MAQRGIGLCVRYECTPPTFARFPAPKVLHCCNLDQQRFMMSYAEAAQKVLKGYQMDSS
jgi:hypothetical protein